MSSEPIIKIEKLKVTIGRKEVIKGIDLEIPRNSVFAIMGPSGSGKSTILRSINRLWDLYPEVKVEGKILLDGKDVTQWKIKRLGGWSEWYFRGPTHFLT